MAHGVRLTFLLSQSNTLEDDVMTRPEIKDSKQLKNKKVGIIRFGGISELAVKATIDVMCVREPSVKKLTAEELFYRSYLTKLNQSGFIDQLYAK